MENPVVAGVLVALVVPFLGNTLGAALVLFARHGMSERFTKALLGFAAGVMIAASVWSLIVPALEAAECGAVEPLGAAIMVAITGLVTPLLPVVLAFAAGAMMYVVTEELIPQTQQGHHTNIGTIGVAFGFVLMMVLDVALG